MKKDQKCALIILDGWGIGTSDDSNAIAAARTPFMDELLASQPQATLRTDGEFVGLPAGQMGNSEVGHMNIGAGRVVYQDLLRINRAIADDSFPKEEALNAAFDAGHKAEVANCTLWDSFHKVVFIPNKHISMRSVALQRPGA